MSSALVGLERIASVDRKLVEPYVKHVVEQIARRHCLDLDSDGVEALTELIERGRCRARRTHVEICSIVLPWALREKQRYMSPLVTVAFPAVYDELRNGRHSSWLDSVFVFLDWDRCKVARRELVSAFMQSDWPPLDLAITAHRACDLRRILKRVLRTSKGRSYFRRIEMSARELRNRTGEGIVGVLKEIQRVGK